MNDRDFILKPREWPHLYLPLKRHSDHGLDTAVFALPLNVMHVKPDEPIEILVGTIFDKLSELPRKRYENVDALLADGWIVD